MQLEAVEMNISLVSCLLIGYVSEIVLKYNTRKEKKNRTIKFKILSQQILAVAYNRIITILNIKTNIVILIPNIL